MKKWRVHYVIEVNSDFESEMEKYTSLQLKLIEAQKHDKLKPQSIEVGNYSDKPEKFYIEIIFIIKAETQFDALEKGKINTSMMIVLTDERATIKQLFANELKVRERNIILDELKGRKK